MKTVSRFVTAAILALVSFSAFADGEVTPQPVAASASASESTLRSYPAPKFENKFTVPEGTMITEPASNVPPAIAALSGAWVGGWMIANGEAGLIVKKVNVIPCGKETCYSIDVTYLAGAKFSFVTVAELRGGSSWAFRTEKSTIEFRLIGADRLEVKRTAGGNTGRTEFFRVPTAQDPS